MANEPSVLDYLKSLLRGKPLSIPELEKPTEKAVLPAEETPPELPTEPETIPPSPPQPAAVPSLPFPWLALLVLGLALMAQIALEPRTERAWLPGAILYLLAAVALLWADWRGEWQAIALPEGVEHHEISQPAAGLTVRTSLLLPAIICAMLAFLTLGGDRFTSLNVTFWVLAVVFLVGALWEGDFPFSGWWKRLRVALRLPWSFKITAWGLVILVSAALVIFFRVYRLNHVPPEMVSDQAEKLLDVWDVRHGIESIFFPRNTGREGFQMYLTAAIIGLFGTGFTFLSLKIGTVLCGLLTLPFIYGLGKEAGNRRAGLFAMLLAGIAYWPNVISRIGLRFTLFPFFTAPTLYFLVRGLRTRKRNNFLLAGLFLGMGLHGYSPFRIVPLVVVLAFVLYALHAQAKGARKRAFWWLAVLVAVSLVVFLPLLRYAIDNPEMFSYRTLTRLGSVEQPLNSPAWLIFLKNLWRALVMFAWDNGEVWVVSIPHRPALDIISGALFHLGVVLALLRYWRRRHWLDLFLLLSIPMLMLPSILSLAFPNENPILNRTAGALVPVFVLTGLALEGLLAGLEASLSQWGTRLGWVLAVLLVGGSAWLNYDLVFHQYQRSYELSSWNTSEMGGVIRDFGALYGETDSAWVVAYPYWVDTRLVGMNAGVPTRDFAIWADAFAQTLSDPRPKLFLIKPEDQTDVDTLRQMYPQGTLSVYQSYVGVDKNFLVFLVPSSP